MEENRTVKESSGIILLLLLIGGGLLAANDKFLHSTIAIIVITLITFLIIILNVEKHFNFFHKLLYVFFSLLTLLIGYGFYNKNSNTTTSELSHLSYNEYEDCGKDLNKWKEVIDDLYDKAIADIADDGVWNEEGEKEWESWEYRRKDIYNCLEKIVDEKFKLEVYQYEIDKLQNLNKQYPKVKTYDGLSNTLLRKFNLQLQ
jgi:hypothetical protein